MAAVLPACLITAHITDYLYKKFSPYDLPFSYNTSVADDEQTDEGTDRWKDDNHASNSTVT